MSIKVTEKKVKGGVDVGITCTVSGKPLVRSNEFGMFCDEKNCVCEKESKKHTLNIMDVIKGNIHYL